MDIMIVNATTGRATMYKPAELIKDARFAVKGKGKLVGYFVKVVEGANVQLVATYEGKDGWRANVTVAI